VICLSASVFSLTNAQLQSLLSKNRQSKSGTKDVLIARVVENSLLGNLPRCSKCSKGTLFYAVSERTGERAEWRVACVCVGQERSDWSADLPRLASPRAASVCACSPSAGRRIPLSWQLRPRHHAHASLRLPCGSSRKKRMAAVREIRNTSMRSLLAASARFYCSHLHACALCNCCCSRHNFCDQTFSIIHVDTPPTLEFITRARAQIN
jgi:hypothetical protein